MADLIQPSSLLVTDHSFGYGDAAYSAAAAWAGLSASHTRDVTACVACVAGRTPDGRRATVQVYHRPWLRVGRADGSDVGGAEGARALLDDAGAWRASGEYSARVSLERVTPFEGYGKREREVARLSFASVRALRWASGQLAASGAEVFDGGVDPSVQFASDSGVSPSGWMRVEGRLAGEALPIKVRARDGVHSTARAVARVRDASALPAFAPHRVACLDIETYSVDGNFPSASEPGNAVFAVSIVVAAMDTEGDLAPDGHPANTPLGFAGSARARFLVALRSPHTGEAPSDAGEGVELRVVETEDALLGEVARVLGDLGVDVLTGWNVHGFDMAYLRERAELLVAAGGAAAAGARALLAGPGTVFATASAGRATGWRDARTQADLSTVATPGMLQVDALPLARVLVSGVPNHKLDTVAGALGVGNKTAGVDAKAIFESFRSGSAADLARVARYCVQDSELVLEVARRTSCVLFVFALSDVAGVPQQSVATTGQMYKVYSAVWCEARRRGFAMSTPPWRRRGEADPDGGADADDREGGPKLPGGHVVEVADVNTARAGHRVAVLDFASLYPSVIMWCNMCPSTLRVEDSPRGGGGAARDPVAARFGADVARGTGPRESDGCVVVEGLPDGKRAVFAPAAASGRPGARDGILPGLLRRLVAARTDARATAKRLRATGEPARAVFHETLGQAIKVLANSVYGSLGVDPRIAKIAHSWSIAYCVTAVGRFAWVRSAALAEERSGHRPPYGDTDSVMVYVPLDAPDPFAWAQALADETTGLFGAPMRMEFEYLLEPGALFLRPKTYAALARSGPGDAGKLVVRGMANVRDDSSPLLRECVDAVLRLAIVEAGAAVSRAATADLVRKSLRRAIGEVRAAATAVGTPRATAEDAAVVERSLVVTKSLKASAASVLADHEMRCRACGAAGARRMPDDEAAAFLEKSSGGGGARSNPSKRRKTVAPCLECAACGRRWAATYVDPLVHPHLRVAMDLERANPGGGGFAGDRVGYLVVRSAAGAAASSKVAEMARDPAAVLRGDPERGVPPSGERVNWAAYYERALHDRLAPLVALACAPFVPELAAPAEGADPKAWAACAARTRAWLRGDQAPITRFFAGAKRARGPCDKAAKAAPPPPPPSKEVPESVERVARFFDPPAAP